MMEESNPPPTQKSFPVNSRSFTLSLPSFELPCVSVLCSRFASGIVQIFITDTDKAGSITKVTKRKAVEGVAGGQSQSKDVYDCTALLGASDELSLLCARVLAGIFLEGELKGEPTVLVSLKLGSGPPSPALTKELKSSIKEKLGL